MIDFNPLDNMKTIPEDFIVEEVPINIDNSGNILVYKLTKRNYTTERAVKHISDSLKIPRKFISYAGVKDKNAITIQHITIKQVSKDRVDSLDLKDIELEYVGKTKNMLEIGDLKNNMFTIVVRNTNIDSVPVIPEEFYVPNYFDEQRFSSMNFEIGLSILKKNFKDAVKLIIESDRDHSELLTNHLKNHENDFVGAIQKIPRKTQLFYVHSVQSKLFNDIVSNIIGGKNIDYSVGVFSFPEKLVSNYSLRNIPLIGWDSELDDTSSLVLKENSISSRDFVVRSIPNLTLEGSMRESMFKVTNFSCYLEKDELNNDTPKKNKLIMKFVLPKGCYATIVVRQVFVLMK